MSNSVTLQCSDGESITLPRDAAGVKTGWGFIGNPYFHGDDSWKMRDGDTVIECLQSHPNAKPVADAYQALHQMWEAERAYWDAVEENYSRQMREREEEELWAPIEHLYQIQDALSR
jgi:hypothetical protein